MNLTLQLRNIDFDFSSGGPFSSNGSSGGCLAEKPKRSLPIAWRVLLAFWIPIWVFFWIWPLCKDPSRLANTLKLIPANSEARQASAYGQKFHAFLRFCKDRLPPGCTFRLIGVDYASIDKVRAFYFLYPSVVAEHAQFILVYQTPTFHEDSTYAYARLNEGSFILRSQPAIP